MIATPPNAASDADLLRDYVASNCHQACTALVERYLPLIYSAAMRQTHEPHLAEDIAQETLVIFSHKACGIDPAILPGWFLKTTHFVASNVIRRRSRRIAHERRAAAMKKETDTPDPTPDAEAVSHVIDRALTRLRDIDRTAIILRYFQDQSFADIASQLQTTESAVQRRISRAVDKLRKILSRQGISVAPSALPVCLSAQTTYSVPPSLTVKAISISSSKNALAHIVTKGAIHTMTAIKLKITIGIAVAILLVGIAIPAVYHFIPAQSSVSPPPAVPATTQQLASRFEAIYGLHGETVRLVSSPPDDVRRDFFARQNFAPNAQDPDFVTSMLIKWKAGKPNLWGYTSTSSSARIPNNLEDIISNLQITRRWELEGDSSLMKLPLEGDVVVDDAATPEQCRAAIENITSDQAGLPIRLVWRDVERPVTVLKGIWNYHAVNPSPSISQPNEAGNTVPTLELYVSKVRPGEGADGTLQETASAISDYIKAPLFIECSGAPQTLLIHTNDVGREPQNLSPVQNSSLVIQHLEEQTGLRAIHENRILHRLFVE